MAASETIKAQTIAVLPLGAHEQHGPHLPFETDTIIAQGIADRLQKAVAGKLNVTFLPAQNIGYSVEHMDVSGSKTLAFDEAVNQWIAIGAYLHQQGVDKLMLLNAHGGNSPLLTIVATELRVRFNMLAVATSWTRFGVPDGLITAQDKSLDIHGGFIETSVMLALRPDLVDMSKAENFGNRQSEFNLQFKHLRAYGPHAFGWKMRDLNTKGVAGNARGANAQAGEEMITHAVKGLSELLDDISRFDNEIFQ
ncbi:creatininase family protein [Brucellaceae bacterium C25G]